MLGWGQERPREAKSPVQSWDGASHQPRPFPTGFGGAGEVPAVGKLGKGCSHPCRWMGLAGTAPAASQGPGLNRSTVGTLWAPASVQTPCTARQGNVGCGGLQLQSPSGCPLPPKPHAGRSSRGSRPPPQLTCTDSSGQASHVRQPTRLMPPVPKKGRCLAICQCHFPPLSPPALPELSQGKGDPQPLRSKGG